MVGSHYNDTDMLPDFKGVMGHELSDHAYDNLMIYHNNRAVTAQSSNMYSMLPGQNQRKRIHQKT